MARARSERARSKATAIEDLTHSLEQLQALLPKIEDLGREGFPYLEGARARTEIQLRECIKRAFGERSPEYQTHRHHKLSLGSPSETKQTLALLKTLMATLEEKKLDLQGLKPAPVEEPPTPPAHPQMTLVPPVTPTPQVTITSMAPVTPPPVTTAVPLATNVDAVAPVAAPPPIQHTNPVVSPPRVVQAVPQQTPPSPPNPQPVAATPIAAPYRPQDTGSVGSQPQAAPARFSATQEVRVPAQGVQPVPTTVTTPPATAAVVPPQFSRTQEIRLQAQAPAVSGAPAAPSPASRPLVSNEFAHLDLAKKLCQRFHAVARQLRLRGEYRATLEVVDEFDLQDLLHALLRLQFDDIGTDEWTPSYTNGAPRTTFLLNHDRLAIIVKKTRTGLSAKELADQVRVDIERYRTRERCAQLLCFIYDPEGRIGNPRGLESDLTTVSDTFTVDVLVAPK